MAVRTVSILGGNWGTPTTWTGGVVPIAGDTVDFTATSGNLTVNVLTNNLAGIDFTNYVGTITFNNIIRLNNASLNLGTGGYTQIGTSNGISFFGASNITCNGVVCPFTLITTGTITLNDDLYFSNNLIGSNVNSTINNFNIYCMSGTLDGNQTISGSSTFIFKGNSIWNTLYSSFDFRLNTIIDCETLTLPTISNRYANYAGGTIRYVRGIFNQNGIFRIIGNCTIIDFNKALISFINIENSLIITMNEFFNGSPAIVTNINIISGSTNYTITFQDGFEKISKFVNINNCTLSKPQQLLVITNSPKNSRNSGIRYINQSPNGIAKGDATIRNTMTASAGGYVKDPNMK